MLTSIPGIWLCRHLCVEHAEDGDMNFLDCIDLLVCYGRSVDHFNIILSSL